MLYAICENGGMVDERILPARYESKAEAIKECALLQKFEDEDAEENGEEYGFEAATYDVVRVLDDGSITTEC